MENIDFINKIKTQVNLDSLNLDIYIGMNKLSTFSNDIESDSSISKQNLANLLRDNLNSMTSEEMLFFYKQTLLLQNINIREELLDFEFVNVDTKVKTIDDIARLLNKYKNSLLEDDTWTLVKNNTELFNILHKKNYKLGNNKFLFINTTNKVDHVNNYLLDYLARIVEIINNSNIKYKASWQTVESVTNKTVFVFIKIYLR